ncbi:MAG: SusD/RagB family nutrient-binding outer membrane lipoprotein, partial [Sphingobacteriaceae bacterium]
MKKIFSFFIVGVLTFSATSCKKYLDINTNPNSPTSTTPALVLPQALVGTASLTNSYDQSLGYPGGFFANVYGFGGYGATVTLNYGTSNFTGLFQSAYDNAEDYQYILNNTTDASLIFSNSIARIMKSYVFAKLVDNYNNVPYSEALTGSTVLTPKYDSAPVIYQDLVTQLNTAIANITKGQAASTTTTKVLSSADPMFAGDMNRWKRFANSLKLRLLVKMAGVASLSSFTTPQFATFDNTIGIIVEDATVNPGYLKQGGRLSPIYGSLAASETNVRAATSILPTRYVYAYYNGGKIQDAGRGSVVY